MSKDRNQEAFHVIAKYHAGGHAQSPLVVREMGEMVQTMKMEQAAKATGWGTLIKIPGNRRRVLIAVSLELWPNGTELESAFTT